MHAPVDYMHDTVISMISYVVSMLVGCIIIIMYTINGFNHDKSQPDHTSQNMSPC